MFALHQTSAARTQSISFEAVSAERSHLRLVAIAPPTRTMQKHEVVFRAGDPAANLVEVVEGAVMVYQFLEDGRRQVVDLVLPGGICGFSSGDGLYPSTGEALRRSVIRSHSRSEAAGSIEFRERLAAFAQRQICLLHQHAVTLGRKTAGERVCSLLMRFMEANFGSAALNGPAPLAGWPLDLPMTRGEMGDYLGLSLETVCRTLTDLRQKAMIEIGRKQGEMRIRNLNQLRSVAGLEAA